MDTTVILIAIAVIALLALYLYNRSKPAPQGTYDDKHVRSQGSIGGGTRAHDDPNVRSSGSIGGGERSHDASDVRSGGSIGGRQQSENERVGQGSTRPAVVSSVQPGTNLPNGARHSSLPPLHERIGTVAPVVEEDERTDRMLHDDHDDDEHDDDEQIKHKDEFRSGGSFGGSRK